jgi:hypothetical protein
MLANILLSITHQAPSAWLILPFVSLLLLIAIGPLFFAHFWHKYYKAIAVILGALVGVYYLIVKEQPIVVAETFAE